MSRVPFIIGFLACITLLTSCFSDPNFPSTPSITFDRVENKVISRGIDSIFIFITIQDGDGDLGVSGQDANFRNNFFVKVKKRVGNDFEEVSFAGGTGFDGGFPILDEDRLADPGPLEVQLEYGFELFIGILGSPIDVGDEIAFDIQVEDRAGNRSNMISTDAIVVGVESD